MHFLTMNNPGAATKATLDHHVEIAAQADLQAVDDPGRAHAIMRGIYRNRMHPAELENMLCAALLELARRQPGTTGGQS